MRPTAHAAAARASRGLLAGMLVILLASRAGAQEEGPDLPSTLSLANVIEIARSRHPGFRQ